ncbi:MAG TPA: S1 family peptidase [Candidatus Nanopelagicales bacterium]|nr:S1 family peptidase [Candidatus Nanopelagicales bacterium]
MRARPFVAAVSAGVMCTAGLTAVGVAGATTPSGAPPSAAVAAPGHEELEQALEPLQGLATTLFPGQFGGLWATGAGDDVRVHVAFAGNALLSTTALVTASQFAYPDVLVPVDVATPLVELEQLLDLMSLEREAVRVGDLTIGDISTHRYDLAVDLPTNVVQVISPVDADQLPAWQDAFAARYGPLVDVVAGSITGPQGCTSRNNCGPNLRAGLQLGSEGGYYCSSAFTVSKDGERRLLSAGHCGNSSGCRGEDRRAPRFHHGRRYGVVDDQACSRQVDAETHSANPDFGLRPWLAVNRRDTRHPVTASTTWDETIQGLTRICKSGAASSLRCGQVTNKYLSPSYVPLSSRFVMTNYCAIPGDSGAAVYRRILKGRAEGIHAGGNVDGPARCANWNPKRDFSVYGHLEYALEALDVSMVYQR